MSRSIAYFYMVGRNPPFTIRSFVREGPTKWYPNDDGGGIWEIPVCTLHRSGMHLISLWERDIFLSFDAAECERIWRHAVYRDEQLRAEDKRERRRTP